METAIRRHPTLPEVVPVMLRTVGVTPAPDIMSDQKESVDKSPSRQESLLGGKGCRKASIAA
jgi:hypothetical protein